MKNFKTCSVCGIDKPLSDFSNSRKSSDGLNRMCRACDSIYQKNIRDNRTEEQKRRTKEYTKSRYDSDRERFKAARREWGKKNPDKIKATQRKIHYGITQHEFESLLMQQNGTCAICGIVFSDTITPHVDHDHTTDIIRGLLCRQCNFGLGHFTDDIAKLHSAIKYLGGDLIA